MYGDKRSYFETDEKSFKATAEKYIRVLGEDGRPHIDREAQADHHKGGHAHQQPVPEAAATLGKDPQLAGTPQLTAACRNASDTGSQ